MGNVLPPGTPVRVDYYGVMHRAEVQSGGPHVYRVKITAGRPWYRLRKGSLQYVAARDVYVLD